jgi:hypothetical protein
MMPASCIGPEPVDNTSTNDAALAFSCPAFLGNVAQDGSELGEREWHDHLAQWAHNPILQGAAMTQGRRPIPQLLY